MRHTRHKSVRSLQDVGVGQSYWPHWKPPEDIREAGHWRWPSLLSSLSSRVELILIRKCTQVHATLHLRHDHLQRHTVLAGLQSMQELPTKCTVGKDRQ